MSRAAQIANALLEADDITTLDAGADPGQYVADLAQERASGKVTASSSEGVSVFYHRTKKNSGGSHPVTIRRMGKTKTWKTRPGEFRIPVKYGLYNSFYITQDNASEWSTKPV